MNRQRACCAAAVLLALCLILPRTQYVGKAQASGAQARAECVVEVSSRRILHEKNADTPLPNASTTKLVTALVILEDCAPDEEVVIDARAAGTEGSSIYAREGERYTVEELLYGLMLRSGNDAAVALALHHSGSIRAFAMKMNERAALLGATNSHFVNPHGLPDKRHVTTARDLALIAAYAMEQEAFRTIVSTRFYAPRGWHNKNKMLTQYEGANGIKTGFTVDAGRCLVTSAQREGMTLVSVVLGCAQMYERSTQLLDTAYADYALTELTDCSPIPEGMELRASFSYPVTREERARIRTEIKLFQPVPKKKGAIAGYHKIFLEKDLLFSQNLYMM